MAARSTSRRRNTGRQAAKSAATRLAAIEGAIDCFVSMGYARSSTIEIAKRGRVSRGAMIHHFPTKRKLLEATVEYIISERIRRFSAEMRSAHISEVDLLTQHGVDVLWKHMQTRLFVAFHELVTAARTDAELARVLKAATARFDKVWREAICELFPSWRDKGALLDLAMDLTLCLLEVMALNRLSHDARQRRQRIRDYLKSRLRDILQAAPQRGDTAVREFLRNAPVTRRHRHHLPHESPA